jgi:hypothetical protein
MIFSKKNLDWLDSFTKGDKLAMRARTRKSEPFSFDKLKDFVTTVLLHLSFYAFIVFLVVFFIDNFS